MGQWELLIVDGMSTDKTRDIIRLYVEQYDNIKLLDNPHHTAPYALNIGIRAAKGQYICRIDAHALFPTDYIKTLYKYIQKLPDASNVGGSCNTLPLDDTDMAKAIAIACSHPLGVGNSLFRTSTIDTPTSVDTIPFGFWKKNLFDEIGLFNEELTRNQDDEFNARTIQHGGHIYMIPGVVITYFARENISKTWNMFYQYGLFKPLVNSKLKHPATLRQFIPPLFVCGLIVGFLLAMISSTFSAIYFACITLYILIEIIVGVQHHNIYLPLAFTTMHLSYGIGYLQGIYKILLKQPFKIEYNR